MTERTPPSSADVERAAERLASNVRHTPTVQSDWLTSLIDEPVHLKLETLQRSGSFKIRGATNAILEDRDHALENGVIAASAGNHAQGVAHGARLVGCSATIVMPTSTPENKVMATEQLGAEVLLRGNTYEEAYEKALERKEETGERMIHPFDDPAVIAGQATVAREIFEDVSDLEWLIVPVGGGGLMAGTVLSANELAPDVDLYPVQCESSSSLKAALEAGYPVDVEAPETLAEGIATGRVGDWPFEIMNDRVEQPLLVDDDDIVGAIQGLIEHENIVAEGAGAAGVAALERYGDELPTGPGGIMICGGNLDVMETIHVLERSLRIDGRLLRVATELKDQPGALSDLSTLIGEAGGNIQFIHHDRSDLGVGARRAKVHIEISVRSRDHGQELLDRLRESGYPVQIREL